MRKVFAALALTLCAFAAGTQSADAVPPLTTYCWNLDGTTCYTIGSTKGCTDGIYYDYVCTCRYNSYTRARYWDCPEVR